MSVPVPFIVNSNRITNKHRAIGMSPAGKDCDPFLVALTLVRTR